MTLFLCFKFCLVIGLVVVLSCNMNLVQAEPSPPEVPSSFHCILHVKPEATANAYWEDTVTKSTRLDVKERSSLKSTINLHSRFIQYSIVVTRDNTTCSSRSLRTPFHSTLNFTDCTPRYLNTTVLYGTEVHAWLMTPSQGLPYTYWESVEERLPIQLLDLRTKVTKIFEFPEKGPFDMAIFSPPKGITCPYIE